MSMQDNLSGLLNSFRDWSVSEEGGGGVQGLFGNPVFNMGMGLLAQSDYRAGPKQPIGAAIGNASQFALNQMGQHQRIQNLRGRLDLLNLERDRQRKANEALAGIFGPIAKREQYKGGEGPAKGSLRAAQEEGLLGTTGGLGEAIPSLLANPDTAQLGLQLMPYAGYMTGAEELAALKSTWTNAHKNALNLGLEPGTEEYDNYVQKVTTPASLVQVNTGDQSPIGKLYADLDAANKAGNTALASSIQTKIDNLTKKETAQAESAQTTAAQAGRRSAADAEKIAAARSAKKDIAFVKGYLYDNPDKLTGLKFGTALGISSGIPFTQGREAEQAIRRALDALVRAKTGAAIPIGEWDFYDRQYIPSPWDTEDGIARKIQRLDEFYQETLKEIGADPDGELRDPLGDDL